MNKVTYSYLIKEEKFNIFKKLKHKEYNKLNKNDIISLINFKEDYSEEILEQN